MCFLPIATGGTSFAALCGACKKSVSKEVLAERLKGYQGPEDIAGPDGLLKQLTKALIEREDQQNAAVRPEPEGIFETQSINAIPADLKTVPMALNTSDMTRIVHCPRS